MQVGSARVAGVPGCTDHLAGGDPVADSDVAGGKVGVPDGHGGFAFDLDDDQVAVTDVVPVLVLQCFGPDDDAGVAAVNRGSDTGTEVVGHSGTTVTELVYRHQLKPVIQTGATVMNSLFGESNREPVVTHFVTQVSEAEEFNQAKPLVNRVGLSGLEPLTSALSGRFRPPDHANRRQRVAVNSPPDKAQR